jgi:hypothetical protein
MYLSKIDSSSTYVWLHYPLHEEVTTDVTKGNRASYEIWFYHSAW